MNDELIKNNIVRHDIVARNYDNRHPEIYNNVEQERLSATIQNIINQLPNNRDLQALDFGAGTGNLTLKFLQHNCRVTAGDVSARSLEVLRHKTDSEQLQTVVFDGKKLPFADNSFDIVGCYSVLHHIPDYLSAIQEMIRVAKPGGLIYLDHEASAANWQPNPYLQKYQQITKNTRWERLIRLIKTWELFSLDFFQAVFNVLFINKRYTHEADIHVWPDDHIEWNEIKALVAKLNCQIVAEQDYLLYNNKLSSDEYLYYSSHCSNTKSLIVKK